MRLHALLAAPLVALLLLAPGAGAGTEQAPEVVDNPERHAPDRDLLAAWAEPGPRGMHVTIKVEGADAPPRDVLYAFLFTVDDGTLARVQYVAGIARGADDALHGIVARSGFDRAGVEGPETFPPGQLEDMEFEAGAPAYARFVIPWGVVAGWEPERVVRDVGAETAFYGRSAGGWSDVDLAQTSGALALDRSLLTPEARAALPWLLGPVGLIVAAILAWVVVKSRRGGARPVRLTPRGPPEAPPAAETASEPIEPTTEGRLRLDPRR